MKKLIDTSLSALDLAGSLCGVPYVGAAATVLREIVQACDEVKVHKRKSKQISDKCVQLLNTLNDQMSKLEGSELQEAVDEVMAYVYKFGTVSCAIISYNLSRVLEKIRKRTGQWARYNTIKCFVKSIEIEQGLERCESELDSAMGLFQVNTQLTSYRLQREAQDVQRSDSAEMRDLLHQILTTQVEMQRIVVMQQAGEHVAEPIMEAGQRELRYLRESADTDQQTINGTIRVESPPLSQTHDNDRYLQYQQGLVNLHRATGVPPTVKVLNGEVKKYGDSAVAGGTYNDIWLGKWLDNEKVAMKTLRNIKVSNPKAQKRFEHEITVWSDLKNDHILPFYGIVTDQGQYIHMISPWQDNGNVLDYVVSNPGVNRIHLLSGAVKGLKFLHSRDIIHGNVKCANILVTPAGEACICDFGMSKVIEEVTEVNASTILTASGSARWLAPELIEGVISSPTKPADTYSYAMAILELLTGKHPFAHRSRDASVIIDIVVHKKNPPRPKQEDVYGWLTDDLWILMEDCWRVDAASRPSITQVALRIDTIEQTYKLEQL